MPGFITSLLGRRMLTSIMAAMVAFGSGSLNAGCSSSPSSDAGMPSGLTISGTSAGWVFHDGQHISISMGLNKHFAPNARLIIVMCPDPGGSTDHLPTRPAQCDENTVQGGSVITNQDGSFSEPRYFIYQLPSYTLGEGKSWLPVCNRTHACVFYVGQDQEDFTKPKAFSHSFYVEPASPSHGGS